MNGKGPLTTDDGTTRRGLSLELPADDFRSIAAPVLERVSGLLAAQLVRAAEQIAEDRASGCMDKEEAAAYLKIKVRALENWMRPVSEGGRGVPHSKLGETVRFQRSRIDRWLVANEVNPLPINLEDAA